MSCDHSSRSGVTRCSRPGIRTAPPTSPSPTTRARARPDPCRALGCSPGRARSSQATRGVEVTEIDACRAKPSRRRRPDGVTHLTPIWFLFEDDRFYFASSSGSRKVRNVQRSAPASVVVDARDPGRERWVSASGLVEILRDGEAQWINAQIRRRYLAPAARYGPIEAALAASDDVTLRLAPTAWRSWTAPSVESPERLFLAVDA